MKKLASILGLVAFVGVSGTLFAKTVTPHVDSLRIRDGHSMEHIVIGEATPGMQLKVIRSDSTDKWYKVQTEDGLIGWVASGYVEPMKY